MTIFILQISNPSISDFDDIEICKDFDELKSAFDGRVNGYRERGYGQVSLAPLKRVDEPLSDDECLRGGRFEFVAPRGYHIRGTVYPYWLDI